MCGQVDAQRRRLYLACCKFCLPVLPHRKNTKLFMRTEKPCTFLSCLTSASPFYAVLTSLKHTTTSLLLRRRVGKEERKEPAAGRAEQNPSKNHGRATGSPPSMRMLLLPAPSHLGHAATTERSMRPAACRRAAATRRGVVRCGATRASAPAMCTVPPRRTGAPAVPDDFLRLVWRRCECVNIKEQFDAAGYLARSLPLRFLSPCGCTETAEPASAPRFAGRRPHGSFVYRRTCVIANPKGCPGTRSNMWNAVILLVGTARNLGARHGLYVIDRLARRLHGRKPRQLKTHSIATCAGVSVSQLSSLQHACDTIGPDTRIAQTTLRAKPQGGRCAC